MKRAYPIILKKETTGYYVVIPDFHSGTQGDTIVECIEMARDCIGILGISMQDDGEDIPEPETAEKDIETGDIVTYVDVDFFAYRKKIDNRAVKKNCTIPYWVSVEADRAKINYSKVLQDAIVKMLNLNYN